MLTPQEVSERAFPKASFGGYNMAQVDEFLDVLTEDYSALYSENAVLKSKMKVLVEKVEEYRSTEEAMRKALMAAQRMADDLVKEAEQKRAQILEEAEAEAGRKVEAIRQEEEAERFRLDSLMELLAALFQRDMLKEVSAIDLTSAAELSLVYDGRLTVKMPMSSEDYLELTRVLAESMAQGIIQPNETGIVDLTLDQPRFIPETAGS